MRSVCVFCGSQPGHQPDYTSVAADVADTIVDLGLRTVYGGGSVGVMGAVADVCLARQAPIVGVIPQSLADVELMHPDVQDMRVVPDMHARKALMHELSDAYLALPGGFGTMEELFEVLCWSQLNLHQCPIAVFNQNAIYQPLIDPRRSDGGRRISRGRGAATDDRAADPVGRCVHGWRTSPQETDMEIVGRHYATNAAIRVRIDGEHIGSIDSVDATPTEDLPLIAPGLFDIQVNGYGGIWFCRDGLTVEDVVEVCTRLTAQGISRFLPTLITASHAALKDAFRVLESARQAYPLVKDCVAGYHLEGPYICAEDGPRGAHPREHVRPADVNEFAQLQQAAGGQIRLLTLAADSPRRSVADSTLSADRRPHSHRSYGRNNRTDPCGRRCRRNTQHAPGQWSAWAVATAPQLTCGTNWQKTGCGPASSLMATHLPNSVLQCVLKCKGLRKTILTCDVSGFAGCAPGTYCEDNMKVDVLADGRLVVSGQSRFLAGSGATTGDCVAHVMASCGLSLPAALQLATANPARFLGMSPMELKTGNLATLCVFRMLSGSGSKYAVFRPLMTYTNGRLLGV